MWLYGNEEQIFVPLMRSSAVPAVAVSRAAPHRWSEDRLRVRFLFLEGRINKREKYPLMFLICAVMGLGDIYLGFKKETSGR